MIPWFVLCFTEKLNCRDGKERLPCRANVFFKKGGMLKIKVIVTVD